MNTLTQGDAQSMKKGVRWEDSHCSLCRSSSTEHLYETKDYRFLTDDVTFNVVRCAECGLVRVNPRPVEEDIHKYYHDDFYRAGESPDEALAAVKSRVEAMAEHVNRYQRGRLLDIGCFRGEFIEHMRRTHGWEVAGVEFSELPPNLYDLNIFRGDVAEAPFEHESFDVVTIWAVLEHVYHPERVLNAVRKFLKPGGRVIILVPNFNSIPARVMHHDDVPRHLTMFTRKTLDRMLRIGGLTPVDWICSQDACSGSVRGWLNFLVKRAFGEPMGEIQAQNRSAERWGEFAGCICNRASGLLRRVDQFDIWLSPRLDWILDRLGFGFIMIVHAQKK
ncbi:MAG: class I SAM-dependent methyltransferase [Parvibaculum sp.]|uniref:class I SAM-dependent methyltransferase n=1 Tax=Parvibaculum sp. TaxID=2024848 RepID=UPI003C75B9D1